MNYRQIEEDKIWHNRMFLCTVRILKDVFIILTNQKKYRYRQSQCFKSWNMKCLAPVAKWAEHLLCELWISICESKVNVVFPCAQFTFELSTLQINISMSNCQFLEECKCRPWQIHSVGQSWIGIIHRTQAKYWNHDFAEMQARSVWNWIIVANSCDD